MDHSTAQHTVTCQPFIVAAALYAPVNGAANIKK